MAMSVKLLLLLTAIVATAGSGSALKRDFHPCTPKKYPVTIKNVLIDPEPVISGDLVTFTVPAFASEELTGGTVVVTVSLYGFKVHTERDNLCGKTECPIKGDFELASSQELPGFTPPGNYKLKFQVLDLDGKEQACASVGFSIVWKLSSQSQKAGVATVANLIEDKPDVATF